MDGNIRTDLPKDCFILEKWMLRYLGLSLEQNQPKRHKAYFFLVVTLMIVYLVLVSLEFLKLKDDFDEFVNNLLFVFGYVVGLLRLIFLFVNGSKLKAILDMLQKGIFAPNSERGGDRETESIKNCINLTKKQVIASAVLGVSSAMMCMAMCYFTKKNGNYWTFPYGVFPIFNSPYNYEIAFCYQVLVYSFIIISYVITDVIYANILVHVYVHCKNVQHCFRNLIEKAVNCAMKEENFEVDCTLQPSVQSEIETGASKVAWKYLRQQLKEVVIYHVAVIDLARETEKLFNVITLISSVLVTLFVCFIMYHASRLSVFSIDFLKDVTILGTATFFLIILSFWANKVMEESQAITSACYETNFVSADVRLQKCLVLIMQRSQRPITLTAGKFANLSLVTMLGVFRTSYSYFMFLRQANRQ